MQGEIITPNTNIQMGSIITPPPAGGSIDPTDYYGQSFDYNEWVKSKVKELEATKKESDNKMLVDRSIALEKLTTPLHKKYNDVLDEEKKFLNSTEYKEAKQMEEERLAKIESDARKAYDAEIGGYAANRAKQGVEGPEYQSYGSWKVDRGIGGFSRVSGIKFGIDKYNRELANKRAELNALENTIKICESAEECDGAVSQFKKVVPEFEKLSTFNIYSEKGKALYPDEIYYHADRQSNYSLPKSQDQKDKESANNIAQMVARGEWTPAEAAAAAASVSPNVANIISGVSSTGDWATEIKEPVQTAAQQQDARDQQQANATGRQVGSAIPIIQKTPTETLKDAGYEFKIDPITDDYRWIATDKTPEGKPSGLILGSVFTGDANKLASYKLPMGTASSEELQKDFDKSKFATTDEMQSAINNIAKMRALETDIKVANINALSNSSNSYNSPYIKDFIAGRKAEIQKDNKEFTDNLTKAISGVQDKTIMQGNILGPSVGSKDGMQIYGSKTGGDIMVGLGGTVRAADYTDALQSAMPNLFGGNTMAGGQKSYNAQQVLAQEYLSKVTGVKQPTASETISAQKLAYTGKIGESNIYGSASGDMVATKDDKFTPLNTITDLRSQQRGEFGINSGLSQREIDIKSEVAKNKLYTLLESPKIENKYQNIASLGKTPEGLTIFQTNNSRDEYVMPKYGYGIPILLSEYNNLSSDEKLAYSQTAAENLIPKEEYNKTPEIKKDLINTMAEKYGSLIDNGKFNIIGYNENFDKVISKFNEPLYSSTDDVVYDKDGNMYLTANIVGNIKVSPNLKDNKDVTIVSGGKRILSNYNISTKSDGSTVIVDSTGNEYPKVSASYLITNPLSTLSKESTTNYDKIVDKLAKSISTGNEITLKDLGLPKKEEMRYYTNLSKTPANGYAWDESVKYFAPVNEVGGSIENVLPSSKSISPIITTNTPTDAFGRNINLKINPQFIGNTTPSNINLKGGIIKNATPVRTGLSGALVNITAPGSFGFNSSTAYTFRKSKSSSPKVNLAIKSFKMVDLNNNKKSDLKFNIMGISLPKKKSEDKLNTKFNVAGIDLAKFSLNKKSEKSEVNAKFKLDIMGISLPKKKSIKSDVKPKSEVPTINLNSMNLTHGKTKNVIDLNKISKSFEIISKKKKKGVK